MLQAIPTTLSPDLLWTMAAMGHGDRLVIVDASYPAYSRHDRVIALVGVPLATAIADIWRLMTIDDFSEMPAFRMVPDGEPGHVAEIHREVQRLLDAAERRPVGMRAAERTPFYDLAGPAFAVVATTGNRPFGCFIITNGVIRSVSTTEGRA